MKSLPTGQCFIFSESCIFPSGEFATVQHMHEDLGDGKEFFFGMPHFLPVFLSIDEWEKQMKNDKFLKYFFFIAFPQASFCCPQKSLFLTRLFLLLVAGPGFSFFFFF